MFVIEIFILVVLLRLLVEIEKPLVCAEIYAGCLLVLWLALGAPILDVLFSVALAFGYSFAWFWCLNRTAARTGLWWLIFFAGLAAPPLVRIALSSLHG